MTQPPKEARPDAPTLEYAGPKPKKKPDRNRQFLRLSGLLTVLPLFVGFYEFHDLGEAEERGGAVSMPSIIAGIYDIAGRYGVLAFFLVLAGFWGVLFFKTLLRMFNKKS